MPNLSTLHEINELMRSKVQQNQVLFIYFVDEKGRNRNIVYQEGSYFSKVGINLYVRLNPLSEVEAWINKINEGTFQLIREESFKGKLKVNRKTLISRQDALKQGLI